MIKLVNIIKEIYIGSGEHGKVYTKGKNKVKKQSNYLYGFTEDELYFYSKFNKYPDIFPKIYKLTKSYVIMDKLHNIPDMDDILNYLEQNNIWVDKDPMTMIYNLLKEKKLDEINIILSKIKNNKVIYNSILKYIKFTQNVLNIFPNKSIDFHSNNIGVDNNGNLKIFDLAM